MAIPFTKNAKLLRAVQKQNVEQVKNLLEADASANTVRMPHGPFDDVESVLYIAFQKKNEAIMILLLEHGADFKRIGCVYDNPPPIIFFTRNNLLEVVDFLIKKGEDINAIDQNKYSALHYAVETENFYSTKFLLERNADSNLRTITGKMALDIAKGHHNQSIIDLFRAPLALPAPAASDVVNDRWELLSSDRIAHIMNDSKIGQKTTDSFNFATRERTLVIRDLEKGDRDTIVKSFDEMKDKTPLERAHDELVKQDGTVLREVIYTAPRHKQRLDGLEK